MKGSSPSITFKKTSMSSDCFFSIEVVVASFGRSVNKCGSIGKVLMFDRWIVFKSLSWSGLIELKSGVWGCAHRLAIPGLMVSYERSDIILFTEIVANFNSKCLWWEWDGRQSLMVSSQFVLTKTNFASVLLDGIKFTLRQTCFSDEGVDNQEQIAGFLSLHNPT